MSDWFPRCKGCSCVDECAVIVEMRRLQAGEGPQMLAEYHAAVQRRADELNAKRNGVPAPKPEAHWSES